MVNRQNLKTLQLNSNEDLFERHGKDESRNDIAFGEKNSYIMEEINIIILKMRMNVIYVKKFLMKVLNVKRCKKNIPRESHHIGKHGGTDSISISQQRGKI